MRTMMTTQTTRCTCRSPSKSLARPGVCHLRADSRSCSYPASFSNALSFAKTQFGSQSSAAQQPIDENSAQEAHQQAYKQGNAASLGTESLGLAAALQAMKSFTGSGSSSGAGGNSQSQVVRVLSLLSRVGAGMHH